MRTSGTLIALVAGTFLVAAQDAGQPPVPERLSTLLHAKDESGKTLLTESNREYFRQLPPSSKTLFADAADKEIITSPAHLREILSLNLTAQKMDLLMRDYCVLCHTDPEIQTPATLFSLSPEKHESPAHLNLKDAVEDIHFRRGLSCAGCHGGDPSNPDMDHTFVEAWPATGRQADRTWILGFCARCHSDPNIMNPYNPGLPTDQLAKYRESPHGKLLLNSGDMRAPQCVSCHGTHGIRTAKNPLSKTNPRRVHETCGSCHSNHETMAGIHLPDGTPIPVDQVEKYLTSIHAKELLTKGNNAAPTCNDCHGNHAAMPPNLANVSQSCSLCHASTATLFDASKHKRAFERHGWPECATCHGNHAVARTHDGMLDTRQHSLCIDCHKAYAPDNAECTATTDFFLKSILSLSAAREAYSLRTDDLATRGLDVELIHANVEELGDVIKQTRAYVHSFDRTLFQSVTDRGEETIKKLESLTHAADEQYRKRQLGLGAAIALTGLLMLVLYIKLRAMENPSGKP